MKNRNRSQELGMGNVADDADDDVMDTRDAKLLHAEVRDETDDAYDDVPLDDDDVDGRRQPRVHAARADERDADAVPAQVEAQDL